MPTSVNAYLDCGRLHGGFARIRCESCGAEHLLAFSCRRRGICGSCQAKRSALFAEWLVEEVLLPVPHRHVVFTIPKALRGLIERERRLHGLMARAAWEVLRDALREAAVEPEGVPGMVVSLQTFGSLRGQLSSAPPRNRDRRRCDPRRPLPLGRLAGEAGPGRAFPPALPRPPEKAERLSASFHETLLSWRRSGFSVDATQRVGAGEEKRMERLGSLRDACPVAAGAVRERPDGRIEIDTPPDPKTGSTVKVLDRLDFVHALCQQIPDKGRHEVRYLGAYANAKRRALRQAFEARGESAPSDVAPGGETSDAPPPSTGARGFACARGSAEAARRSSWARMLRKVFEVEPLICPRCRQEMVIVAWITDPEVVDRILKHRRERGLVSPFESRAPPPG